MVDTNDLEDISWSPNDRFICVWDSSLEYNFIVYSPDGSKLAFHCAYENALGIKSIGIIIDFLYTYLQLGVQVRHFCQ